MPPRRWGGGAKMTQIIRLIITEGRAVYRIAFDDGISSIGAADISFFFDVQYRENIGVRVEPASTAVVTPEGVADRCAAQLKAPPSLQKLSTFASLPIRIGHKCAIKIGVV